MTVEQIRAAIEWITAIIRGLTYEDDGTTLRSMSEDESTQAEEGFAELERLDGLLKHHERVAALNAAGTGVPGDNPTPPNVNRQTGDDPYDLRTLPFNANRDDLRGRALDAIERTEGITDEHKANATSLLERHETPGGALSRHVLSTGSDAYRTGWQKMVSGNPHLLDESERHALEASRALSLTDANGGFAVPFTLDPTIIDTRDGTTNPFRQISTVRTTVTDQWQGVTSGGMTVSWDGEATEVSDDSPTIDDAPIPVHKAQGFAVASIEITQDWRTLESDLNEMIRNAKDDAEASVFATGTGTNQPTGIVTALDGTSSEVAPATAETFAVADLYAVEEALPPKYRGSVLPNQPTRASWVANKAIYNDVRQFGTSDSHALWERLGAAQPPQLLGYSAYEASAMDSGFDASAAADNFLLILGDFRNYVIVDRVGLSVEFIPHIFGANNRPTGQRGWYCYWRVGGDSVNVNAFRMLNVETTV